MRDSAARRLVLPAAIALIALLAACTNALRPASPIPAAGKSSIPVVFIPGTTGTALVDASGRSVWGDARSFFFPRDRGYALALPLDGRPGGIQPGETILDIRLLGYRRDVYRPLLEFMRAQGYRAGSLKAPRPEDEFFFFSYDWRRGSIENAAELHAQLENLRIVRGENVLRVNLVAQSSAAYIARWFLKYGSASLDEAERGSSRRSTSVRVEKFILVGTSNGGAIRILREMNRGRRYAPFGRFFSPEIFFTFPSLYEDLPVYTTDRFVDRNGDSLESDLFDANEWKSRGWSLFEKNISERIRGDTRFGTEPSRLEWLQARLDEAKRFHRLLHEDSRGFPSTRYYSLQDRLEATPARGVLGRDGETPATWFPGDAEVDRTAWLRYRTVSPGDRHATLDSQQWLSPQEVAALEGAVLFFEGAHFEIVLNRALHRKLAEILGEP